MKVWIIRDIETHVIYGCFAKKKIAKKYASDYTGRTIVCKLKVIK